MRWTVANYVFIKELIERRKIIKYKRNNVSIKYVIDIIIVLVHEGRITDIK